MPVEGLSGDQTAPAAAKKPDTGGGSVAPSDESERQTRPEWVPADHWNEEAGSLNLETFGAHYGELSEAHRTAEERAAALPQKPEDVKFTLPEGFDLPEGAQIDEANPLFAEAKQVVVDAKGDPTAVANGLYALWVKQQAGELKQFKDSIAAEKTKLGANPAARVAALDQALTAAIGKERVSALLGDLGDPAKSRLYTAAAVEAAEFIVKKLSGQGAATPPAGATQQKKPEPSWEQKMWPKRFATAKAG
jgi:hypothetical protein